MGVAVCFSSTSITSSSSTASDGELFPESPVAVCASLLCKPCLVCAAAAWAVAMTVASSSSDSVGVGCAGGVCVFWRDGRLGQGGAAPRGFRVGIMI